MFEDLSMSVRENAENPNVNYKTFAKSWLIHNILISIGYQLLWIIDCFIYLHAHEYTLEYLSHNIKLNKRKKWHKTAKQKGNQ